MRNEGVGRAGVTKKSPLREVVHYMDQAARRHSGDGGLAA
jgi:hypothetical protein